MIALAAKHLFKAALSILIHILDFIFPILLQLARFPLFTVRILGDGLAILLKIVTACLPISRIKREQWVEAVHRRWSWLRQKITYKTFEAAVHRAFESGMAWVFRTCRTLTPGAALLVIAGAVLWLPVSFGAATAMHAFLIAKATSLPAWMQLLHPLATVIAKSKLLILPAYPAAWPQAKQHPLVQAIFRLYEYCSRLHLIRKTRYRYRQTQRAVLGMADALSGAAIYRGFRFLLGTLFAGVDGLAGWIGRWSRVAISYTLDSVLRVPVIGPIVQSYAAQYGAADQGHAERFSERVSRFFTRWSMKFSPDYYEPKELQTPEGANFARP